MPKASESSQKNDAAKGAETIDDFFPGYEKSLLWTHLPLVAAIYAALLTVLNNLENYFSHKDRAHTYRKSRELFLDAGREFEMLWHVKVRPHGYGPEACTNAAILYQKIVEKDIELRATVMELTGKKKSREAKK